MKKVLVILLTLALLGGCIAGFAGCSSGRDEGVILIRNLYFEDWSAQQGDSITRYIEDTFDVTFETSTYSFEQWTAQVTGDVMNPDETPDVFQANVTSYNLNTTYIRWADGLNIKPLPDDLSRWPYLKHMLETTKDIEYLKYKGKYYGIPVARNIDRSAGSAFAPFTYMYRRDVAKELNRQGKCPYNENDVYDWTEFNQLLAAFKEYFASKTGYALGDAEWGYPSVLNFYKTAPHCFAKENNQIVNNYNTSDYLEGLGYAKGLVSNSIYYKGQLQAAGKENLVKKEYTSKRLGIFYENLSMQNYIQIRDELTKNGVSAADLDDYTAIMRVQGPDGNYALEGQEDWFSMTFINYDVSDAKMEKILDIMDWLLSEKGTMTALYGIEGVDYEKHGDDVELIDGDLWSKGSKREYIESPNGARYLRYMVTLGHDIIDRDPLVLQSKSKKDAYDILNAWEEEMNQAYKAGDLKVLTEDPQVKWMQSKEKLDNAGKLLDAANTMVLNYTFEKKTIAEYTAAMTNDTWNKVLTEINANWHK